MFGPAAGITMPVRAANFKTEQRFWHQNRRISADRPPQSADFRLIVERAESWIQR